jgi:3-carboxy-cis,cis-muconate cycloisomerase
VARGGLAETAAALGIVCGNLAKFATDIVLLMQTEIGEVNEPHTPGRGASSTMPQKRNPIASEYILAAARGVHALVPLMLGAMAQDHERGTGPWQAELLALPQIFVLTAGALAHAAALAEGMTVARARMRANLEASGGLILAEAIMMALAEKIGKQDAHRVVQRACDRAMRTGKPLVAVLRADAALKGKIAAGTLARLADPAGYLGESRAVVDRVAARADKVLARQRPR